MTARLKRLELEGFRGFSERCVIDLDADAVVIRGDNGTGKTSLVDGLLWIFCGELAHLVERQRGLRRTEDVVTNRFNPYGATVSLAVTGDGREYVFTRTGDQRKTTLSATVDGAEVTDDSEAHVLLAKAFGLRSPDELRQAVMTWGLLRQDSIRSVLDEAGGALHQRVSGLMGLERVSGFATAATRAAADLVRQRTAARQSRDRIVERHRNAVDLRDEALRAAGRPEEVARLLVDGVRALAGTLAPGVLLKPPETVELQSVGDLGAALGRVVGALDVLRERHEALARQAIEPDSLVADAEKAATDAAEAVSTASNRAPSLVLLASSASELLGDRCPVCEQPIDAVSVRSHLREVLEGAQDLVAGAQAAQDALVRAQAALASAREHLRAREESRAGVAAAEAAVRVVLADEVAFVEVEAEWRDEPGVIALSTLLREALDQLRDLYRSVQQASGAHVARLGDDVDALAAEVATILETLEALEARCERARQFQIVAHDAAQHVLEDTLEVLRPTFAEVFDRLSPSPAFTQLHAKQDVLRNRNQIVPMVRDVERGVEANPLLIFSEGQLNVVALSYFLGMAMNAGEAALPFLVLDDPLQALDVIAILGFSDLCRHVRDGRQLIVTTHDRRFADVLVRKLSPRDALGSLVVQDFAGWTREGPIVNRFEPMPAEVIPLLRRAAS